jgi:hypothetical protein
MADGASQRARRRIAPPNSPRLGERDMGEGRFHECDGTAPARVCHRHFCLIVLPNSPLERRPSAGSRGCRTRTAKTPRRGQRSRCPTPASPREAAHQVRPGAGRGAGLADRHRTRGEQVGDLRARHDVRELDGHEAGQQSGEALARRRHRAGLGTMAHVSGRSSCPDGTVASGLRHRQFCLTDLPRWAPTAGRSPGRSARPPPASEPRPCDRSSAGGR